MGIDMQVTNVSQKNNYNFTGRVYFWGTKNSTAYEIMNSVQNRVYKLIKDKPFDLLVEQEHADDFLSITVTKSEKFKPYATAKIFNFSKLKETEQITDVYIETVEKAIGEYEKRYSQNTFVKKLKSFLLRKKS